MTPVTAANSLQRQWQWKSCLVKDEWPGQSLSVCGDGAHVIFASPHAGNSVNVWRIDGNGGNLLELTKGSLDQFGTCSPDGKWIAYTSTDEGKFKVWRASIDGGGAQQLTDTSSYTPAISPDGKSIAYLYGEGAGATFRLRMAVMPSTGGEVLRQFDALPNREGSIRFTPDGQGIAYAVTDEQGVGNIWVQPLGGGPAEALTDFKADKIFDFAWSRDGRKLAVSRGRTTRDVVLLTDTGK